MLSEELFIKHVRKQHLQFHIPGPCVYDINTTNILSSPQGNWGLVLKDLQLVVNSELIKSIDDICMKQGIQNAFNFRVLILFRHYLNPCLSISYTILLTHKSI